MKQLLLTLALVALTACATAPPAPTLPPETPGASSGDIGDWLESPHLDVRDHALDMIRADPGAYLPTTFAWVANELHRRGETVEAAKWGDFGRQRLALDIALMMPGANEDQRRFLALLPERYADDLGEDFPAAYRSLTPTQLLANFEEVQGLEVLAIRRYPPHWAFDAGHAYAMNWGAEPNQWSVEDLGRLNALYLEHLPTFRSALQAAIDAQAAR
ncbi:MAG: hypothetical protein JNL81_06140 [Hyphomonadaceae bacterium]|nr:hypothetical protein [Hyphomonadaceae bacterium]